MPIPARTPLRPARAALVALALLCAGCGPLVLFPGGRLSGNVKPAPTDWSFAADVEVIQIETRPDDPYSVNLWGVSHDDTFYVMSGDPESGWAANLLADPRLRLKVCDDLYEMRATPVEDAATRAAVLAAVEAKYDFVPPPEQVEEGLLFALSPR